MNRTIQIVNSTQEDLETIFTFYDYAIAHQKKVSDQHWQGFDRALIRKEINEQRQYKILVKQQIACIFVVTFGDPEIWQERNTSPAIYLHRIVTHPHFRGYGFVKRITDWAIEFAKNNELAYVRLDTWASNKKLGSHYLSCGYALAGTISIQADSTLPKHYAGIILQLFEIKVQ